MSAPTTRKATTMNRMLPLLAAAGWLLATAAQAAAPGITGTGAPGTFNVTAQPAYISQPDGQAVYSWGYGCRTAPTTSNFVPASLSTTVPGNIPVTPFCSTMQVPGPTLVVTEGQPVTVQLTNNLPTSAGNTSILFPGFNVTATGGVTGLLTQEAAPGGTVSYTFTAGAPGCSLNVPTEPYRPGYFMINGRSMPDDMDTNYAAQYQHQPYNGNPHMHPGDLTLLRIIGQGRWQHPFHEHGNHVRVLARDGNLIVAGTSGTAATQLAGPLLFTTTTTPGQAMDGIFYWTGKGLNWDAYAHHPGSSSDPLAHLGCTPDANGYNTGNPTAVNYYEWCQDHNKPMQAAPFGDVGGGGPVTLPDPNLFTNGAWYGGSPYLGPDATQRFAGPTGTTSTATCTALNKAVAAAALTPTPLLGVWSPVVITVPTGQTLQINLTNSLSFLNGNTVPTSLVIVGQLGGGLGSNGSSCVDAGGVNHGATCTPSPDHTNAQPLTWPIAGDAPGGGLSGAGTPPTQGPRVQSFSTA